MNRQLQIYGLFVLCALAVIILVLMGWTFSLMTHSASADGGRVSGMDAGTFTGLSLMFREVLGIIKSLWEHEDRANLTDHLAGSTPTDPSRPTGEPGDPVHTIEEGKR
jgi:hypothetical protein